jgi:cytochrome P450
VKEIHRVGGRYLKASFYTHIGHRSLKTLFSTTDPVYHAVRRRLLSAPIASNNLAILEAVVMDSIRLTINRMAEELSSQGFMDVFKWWIFMATDIIGELSFGESFHMLEAGKKNQYIADLEGISSHMAYRTTFPFLVRIAEYLPLPLFKHTAAAGARLGAHARQSIARYRSVLSSNPTNPKSTLFTKLFDRGPSQGLTDSEITHEAAGYISAGSHTTAITLTYLVYAVCNNAVIRDTLVAELSSLPEHFTESNIRDLPYLKQVIYESLRLYPAVPGALPREVPKGGANLAGYQVPGGTTVSTQAYSLHRNETVFLDPERYIRLLEENDCGLTVIDSTQVGGLIQPKR